MSLRPFRALLAVCAALALIPGVPGRRSEAQTAVPRVTMSVDVDATHVTRGLLHVHERIAVVPGVMTLEYPRWIPGEHAPSGPIVNLAALVITAGATRLRYERDLTDLNAFHIDVPPGTSTVDVRFDFLGASAGRGGSTRLATPNIMVLKWHEVLLVPSVEDYRTVTITPSVTLPGAAWQYATALTMASQNGPSVTFAPVTMEMLVDSPLDAGTNVRRWPLGTIDGAPVELVAFADVPEQLAADAVIPKFRNLVTQMTALYRARHFDRYTFLLTVSDQMPDDGVEHHQSSDNGVAGNYLTDHDTLVADGDLLPHEFNHSWNGKYRRPADLATPNLRVPMKDDLLWVYEGLTEFYGYLEAARSGLTTAQEWRDHLARTYANLDTTTGRAAAALADTAVAAPLLYSAPAEFRSERRSLDFYSEAELMWLEADMTIRRLSGGRRSLDDFARAFFGRATTGPEVLTYTRADVISALNALQPYDWSGFFTARVDEIAPHPPDPFTPGGWRVTYAPKASSFETIVNHARKIVDVRYSLGIVGGGDGVVTDVIDGSPAQEAGVAPGDKIVAVDGRAVAESQLLQEALDAALVRAAQGPPMRLLLLGGGVYRDVAISYNGGPRYPVLVPIAGAVDRLGAVAKPL